MAPVTEMFGSAEKPWGEQGLSSPCWPCSQIGAQDASARHPLAVASPHPSHLAAPAEGGVLFIVPAGWGQVPPLNQSQPPGDLVSFVKPGPYAYPRVPRVGADRAGAPI